MEAVARVIHCVPQSDSEAIHDPAHVAATSSANRGRPRRIPRHLQTPVSEAAHPGCTHMGSEDPQTGWRPWGSPCHLDGSGTFQPKQGQTGYSHFQDEASRRPILLQRLRTTTCIARTRAHTFGTPDTARVVSGHVQQDPAAVLGRFELDRIHRTAAVLDHPGISDPARHRPFERPGALPGPGRGSPDQECRCLRPQRQVPGDVRVGASSAVVIRRPVFPSCSRGSHTRSDSPRAWSGP